MSNYIALIPAAGFGSRMGNEVPKQYLPLLGKPMIFHAIKRLCNAQAIKQVYVVLSPEDTIWNEYDWSAYTPKLKPLFCGGDSRADVAAPQVDAVRHRHREEDLLEGAGARLRDRVPGDGGRAIDW